MCYREFKTFFNNMLSFTKTKNAKLFIVGGFIRDLLSKDYFYSNDIDFVTSSDTKTLANDFVKIYGGEVKVFDSFFTAKVINITSLKNIKEIDFARFRKEIYLKDGAFPKVESTDSIFEDLKRRDFSINTLIISIEDFVKAFDDKNENINREIFRKLIINNEGGLEDLDNKIIRVLHNKSFYDDPTRILRAFKYKWRIGGEFDDNTNLLLKDASNNQLLNKISKSRVLKELEKIKSEKNGDLIIKDIEKYYGKII